MPLPRAYRRLRAGTRFRVKSTINPRRSKYRTLDISGKRKAAFRRRRLSLLSKARLLAGSRKQYPFITKREFTLAGRLRRKR